MTTYSQGYFSMVSSYTHARYVIGFAVAIAATVICYICSMVCSCVFVTRQMIQWNLSKTTTCGPVLTDLYREVAALQQGTAIQAILRPHSSFLFQLDQGPEPNHCTVCTQHWHIQKPTVPNSSPTASRSVRLQQESKCTSCTYCRQFHNLFATTYPHKVLRSSKIYGNSQCSLQCK